MLSILSIFNTYCMSHGIIVRIVFSENDNILMGYTHNDSILSNTIKYHKFLYPQI